MMRRWLEEAIIHMPQALDPLLNAGRRYVMPVLRRTLPAARLVGKTGTGELARVLVVDRRYGSGTLCRLLFDGKPAVEWSGEVPLTGLRGFLGRERQGVDLVLATLPSSLPTAMGPERGVAMPARVQVVLPVMADREAQYRLAHTKRRNRLRRAERAGYGWRVGTSRDEIRQFIENFHQPHVTSKFGDDVIIHETFLLERHALRGGILWLSHEGREVGGDLFTLEGDETLSLVVTGMVADAPEAIPSPQEAVFLFATDLARRLGCSKVDMRGAAPLLREGLLQFKVSLGADIVDDTASLREMVIDWARPSAVLHALLRRHPLIVRQGRGFAALTSTVDVDPTAHLREIGKFMPPGIAALLALEPGAETIEAAMRLTAMPGAVLPSARTPEPAAAGLREG
jgi:hypothetical protein